MAVTHSDQSLLEIIYIVWSPYIYYTKKGTFFISNKKRLSYVFHDKSTLAWTCCSCGSEF